MAIAVIKTNKVTAIAIEATGMIETTGMIEATGTIEAIEMTEMTDTIEVTVIIITVVAIAITIIITVIKTVTILTITPRSRLILLLDSTCGRWACMFQRSLTEADSNKTTTNNNSKQINKSNEFKEIFSLCELYR